MKKKEYLQLRAKQSHIISALLLKMHQALPRKNHSVLPITVEQPVSKASSSDGDNIEVLTSDGKYLYFLRTVLEYGSPLLRGKKWRFILKLLTKQK